MNYAAQLAVSVIWALAVLMPTNAADAADAPKPDAACAPCQGAGGRQPTAPDTPRLAGQRYDYLVEALNQYRDGARDSPAMKAMAKSLSASQIETLARYFAAHPGLTVKY